MHYSNRMKKTYTLVTGASNGIGKELAIIAAEKGRNVIIVARNEAALLELSNQFTNVEIIPIVEDLAKAGAAERVVNELKKRQLQVDTLINNAGFGDSGAFLSSNLSKQSQMVQLNITTLMELTHLLLPAMVKQKHGRVMNVGSVAGFIPGPYMSTYYATKAFVLSFSQSLHEELKETGVTVTCLCPGPTKTDFAATAHTSKTHPTQTTAITPRMVAEYGYKSMLHGKAIAVHGTSNKMSVFVASRLLPRVFVRWAVAQMQK